MLLFVNFYLGGRTIKKFLSLFVCLVLLLTVMSTAVFAESDQKAKVKSSDGREVTFTIKAGLKAQITEEMLKDLANENPDTTDITILDIGYAAPVTIESKSSTTESGSIDAKTTGDTVALSLVTIIGPVVKGYTATNVLESDRFMASCARGETKTVTTTITVSLSPSYTGAPLGGLTLNGSISYSITQGSQLVGPPEGSTYNTREFRCKFYENRGNWSQFNIILGFPVPLSGTFKEPNHYVSYSIDRTV